MAGGRVYGGAGGSSTLRVLLQNKRTEPLDSLFFSGSCNSSPPPPSFLGNLSLSLCKILVFFVGIQLLIKSSQIWK